MLGLAPGLCGGKAGKSSGALTNGGLQLGSASRQR